MTSSTTRSRAFRWAAIGGGVFGLLLIIILIVPFLVDFSHFKPIVRQVVSNAIQADLDYDSARLQLFPRIGIKVRNVRVTNTDKDFKGTVLFAVESALIDAKLIPLLSGKLRGEVIIDAPEFTLARKGLSNNIASLARPKNATTAAPTPAAPAPDKEAEKAAPPATSPADQAKLFAMIKDKILIEAIRVNDARVTIRDAASGAEPVRVTDLDIEILDIGLERDIRARVSTTAGASQSGARVAGDIVLETTTRVTMGDTGLKEALFSGKLDMDHLAINARDAFVKKDGIPLNVAFKGIFKPNALTIEQLDFNLHTLSLRANAAVNDFTALNLKAGATIDNKDLAALGDLLPQHKKLLAKGSVSLATNIEGAASKPDTIKINLAFVTRLTGTDLAVRLDATSAFPFKGNLAIDSQRVDVDALLKPFRDESPQPANAPVAATPQATSPTTTSTPASAPPAKDFELSPELKTLLMGTDGTIHVDMRDIAFSGQSLTNIILDANLKDLKARLRQFGIDGFGGTVRANGDVDLGASPLAFRGDFQLNNVQPELIVALVKPEHKDLMKGHMNLALAVYGAGTTVPTLNKTLNGQGSFRFLDGELHTTSVASLVQSEYDSFASSVMKGNVAKSAFDAANKILNNPLAKRSGKSPPDLSKIKSDIDNAAALDIAGKGAADKGMKDVSGTIEIRSGRVYINSVTPSETGAWIVASNVGLDMSLGGGATWIASPSTKETMLKRSKYAAVLFNDKGDVVINSTLGGTVMDPKVALTVDQLQKNITAKLGASADKDMRQAAEQFLKSLTGKDIKVLKSEAQKVLKDLLAPPPGGGKKPSNKPGSKQPKKEDPKAKLKNQLGL